MLVFLCSVRTADRIPALALQLIVGCSLIAIQHMVYVLRGVMLVSNIIVIRVAFHSTASSVVLNWGDACLIVENLVGRGLVGRDLEVHLLLGSLKERVRSVKLTCGAAT